MNERKTAQRGFVVVTLITLLAIATVIVIYATLIATIPGGEVLVGENVGGMVYYSETNSTSGSWSPTLNVASTSTPWYARINFTSTYTGKVTITWNLQKMNADWTNMTSETTTVVLDGLGNQAVYDSSNGQIAGNHDWSIPITQNGQYRIEARVETTS
ncbi:MAG: hypothetical protein O2V44_07805 [Candidatus Bathyarchaeota archaeon]|nr:hypothetical protein [Candidatus Bathyarchaeota archaeon]